MRAGALAAPSTILRMVPAHAGGGGGGLSRCSKQLSRWLQPLREIIGRSLRFPNQSESHSVGRLEEETMRAKTMRPAPPVDLNAQRSAGLGRAILVAIAFTGGMYALAAALIGMV